LACPAEIQEDIETLGQYIKQKCVSHIGLHYLINHTFVPLTWLHVQQTLQMTLSIDVDSEDHAKLAKLFSPIAEYWIMLKQVTCLTVGYTGMLQHRFKQELLTHYHGHARFFSLTRLTMQHDTPDNNFKRIIERAIQMPSSASMEAVLELTNKYSVR